MIRYPQLKVTQGFFGDSEEHKKRKAKNERGKEKVRMKDNVRRKLRDMRQRVN